MANKYPLAFSRSKFAYVGYHFAGAKLLSIMKRGKEFKDAPLEYSEY